jgi:hypothetical protein
VRKSIAPFLALPLLIAGCGGSKETAQADRTASSSLPASNRAPVSFNLNTGSGSGRVTLNLTHSDAYYQYYEGTWQGQRVRFADGPSASSITIWNGSLAVASYNFASYRVSDFPTKMADSISGQYSYYDSNLKTQIKFKLAPAKASP